MNWTRIPHIPSIITVAMIPATTAPELLTIVFLVGTQPPFFPLSAI
jgi:hypothetical protein